MTEEEDTASTRRVSTDEMEKLSEMVGGLGKGESSGEEEDEGAESEAIDDDGSHTQRVSADQMDQLRDMLENKTTTEVPVELSDDVLERVDALIPKMDLEDGSPEPLQRAMAVRQIFMTGLYAMESELSEQ